jgi:hypothetical protein
LWAFDASIIDKVVAWDKREKAAMTAAEVEVEFDID